MLDRLCRQVQPASTVLDVGRGAGRYALPLALRCRHVTVVEPSPAMVGLLLEEARLAGIEHLSVVPRRWEDADVEPAEVVLCANVVYDVTDIEPFIRQLTAGARERVGVLMAMEASSSRFSTLWRAVHGEARIDLPAVPELLPVLWEMGIFPDLEMVGPVATDRPISADALAQLACHLVYAMPGTTEGARLQAALRDQVRESTGGLTVRGLPPRRDALISWRPADAR